MLYINNNIYYCDITSAATSPEAELINSKKYYFYLLERPRTQWKTKGPQEKRDLKTAFLDTYINFGLQNVHKFGSFDQ